MTVTYCTFAVGVLLFILGIIQWNLHATDGGTGETWDNEIQEKLYYTLLPISSVCIFAAVVFGLLGL